MELVGIKVMLIVNIGCYMNGSAYENKNSFTFGKEDHCGSTADFK